MSTTPLSLSYLALDSSYDPIFANGTSLTNLQAVTQAILTRLRLFLGEWWENLNLGLPVFQTMLGQLGTQRVQQAAAGAVTRDILSLSPYVTAVSSVSVTFTNGRLNISAVVQTAFGTVQVQTAPGASAVL